MQNYSEWLSNKMYEGHVRRLTLIKQKQSKSVKTLRHIRVKSQPSQTQKQTSRRKFLPLPLVSKDQRLLLGQVIKGKSINLRQKQSLLQNYLLSKRIIQTHSVFSTKLLKRQFCFHKKVSENMSRNHEYNRRTFSQLRKKNYLQLQKLKEQEYMGKGKVFFNLKINEIILIKKKLQQNNESTFNLIYKPEKLKSYPIKSLTVASLFSRNFNFRATQKQISCKAGLKFQLQELRGNQVRKIAEFNLRFDTYPGKQQQFETDTNINPQVNPQETSIKLVQDQTVNRTFQKLLHPLTKCLVGTIQLQMSVRNTSDLSSQK